MTAPDRPDRPLTLEQAAAELGISREAVRSRLRRGKLAGEQRADGWVVWSLAPVKPVAPVADRSGQADRAGSSPRPEPPSARDTEVAWLRAEVERRDRELEAAAVERAELRRLLAMYLPALPAATPPEHAENGHEKAGEATPPRRPWWRFWER